MMAGPTAALHTQCLGRRDPRLRVNLITLAMSFANILNKILKGLSIERLSQNPQFRRSCLGCITVPSREDDRQIGITRADFSREPNAIDRSWHHDVAENKVNLCPACE